MEDNNTGRVPFTQKWDLNKKSKKFSILLLSIVILIQLGFITFFFTKVKEGWFCDEPWFYGFANGDGLVNLFENEQGDVINENEWKSGKLVKDYIEVQKGTEFSYGTVLKNVSIENNPPLYPLLLHTVCSFFPDSFSFWYGYLINVIAFIFTQIFLYLLAYEISRNRNFAFLTILGYGFTIGAVFSFILIRCYALLGTMATALFYLHARMYEKRFENCKKELLFTFLLMYIGIFNQYEFMMLGFFLTVVFAFFALCNKKWKFLISYLLVMGGSVLLIFATWPHSRDMLLKSGTMYEHNQMPFYWEFKYSVILISREIFGFKLSFPDRVFWAYVFWGIVLLFIASIGVYVLVRKNQRFIRGKERFRSFLVALPGKLKYYLYNHKKFHLILFTVIVATIALVAHLCNIFSMGACADRYYFFIEPALYMEFMAVLYGIFQWKKLARFKRFVRFKSIFLLLILVLFIGNGYRICDQAWFFKRNATGVSLEDAFENHNVILASYYEWRMVQYFPLLEHVDHFYYTDNQVALEEISLNGLKDIPQGAKDYYVILEKGIFFDEEIMKSPHMNEETIKAMVGTGITEEHFLHTYQSVLNCNNLEKVGSCRIYSADIEIFHMS